MRTAILLGSSRKGGDTEKAARALAQLTGGELIDLSACQFSYYDYEHQNREDDFIPLMRRIIENYDLLIFATPVYWYSMSGIMKVFFDRMTDLITIEKDLGRKLRGKNMAVISSSNGSNLGDQFWLPFTASAEYLGMNYLGNLHTVQGEDYTETMEGFVKEIERVDVTNDVTNDVN